MGDSEKNALGAVNSLDISDVPIEKRTCNKVGNAVLIDEEDDFVTPREMFSEGSNSIEAKSTKNKLKLMMIIVVNENKRERRTINKVRIH